MRTDLLTGGALLFIASWTLLLVRRWTLVFALWLRETFSAQPGKVFRSEQQNGKKRGFQFWNVTLWESEQGCSSCRVPLQQKGRGLRGLKRSGREQGSVPVKEKVWKWKCEKVKAREVLYKRPCFLLMSFFSSPSDIFQEKILSRVVFFKKRDMMWTQHRIKLIKPNINRRLLLYIGRSLTWNFASIANAVR